MGGLINIIIKRCLSINDQSIELNIASSLYSFLVERNKRPNEVLIL